jgi:hypothetical protein
VQAKQGDPCTADFDCLFGQYCNITGQVGPGSQALHEHRRP